MKHLVNIAIALVALPLFAEEPKKAEPQQPAPAAAPAKPAAPKQLSPTTQPDSPLVAAAKATRRLGKKPTNVITNDNLKASGANAHVTTAATQPPLNVPEVSVPKDVAMRNEQIEKQRTEAAAKAEEEKKQKAAEETRRRRIAAAAAAAESGAYSDGIDPAQAEALAEEEAKKEAQKPPQG